MRHLVLGLQPLPMMDLHMTSIYVKLGVRLHPNLPIGVIHVSSLSQ